MQSLNPDSPRPASRRVRYPSDLSDRQWARVAPLLPAKKRRGRPRSTDFREIVNGLNYRWTTGCAWRMLPHDFPPWSTIYCHVRHWNRNGLLARLRDALLRRRRTDDAAARGRSETPILATGDEPAAAVPFTDSPSAPMVPPISAPPELLRPAG